MRDSRASPAELFTTLHLEAYGDLDAYGLPTRLALKEQVISKTLLILCLFESVTDDGDV